MDEIEDIESSNRWAKRQLKRVEKLYGTEDPTTPLNE